MTDMKQLVEQYRIAVVINEFVFAFRDLGFLRLHPSYE